MTHDQKEAALNCVYAYETSDVYKALQDALTELEAHKAIAASFVKAEQEPMYISESCAQRGCACHYSVEVDGEPVTVYAAPVRTKDLTDDEIEAIRIGIIAYEPTGYGRVFARAVIAADREKNK